MEAQGLLLLEVLRYLKTFEVWGEDKTFNRSQSLDPASSMSYITSYPVHNEFYSYKRVTKMAHIYNKDRERDSYDQ